MNAFVVTENYGKDDIWVIRPSSIQGEGIHAATLINAGDMVGVAIKSALGFLPVITRFGSKINHSYNPNSVLRYDYSTGTHNIYALTAIYPGIEITADYRFTPAYILGPAPHYR